MAKRVKQGKALTNPVRLSPRDPDDPKVVQVIIETPKGSRNKYALDSEQRIFELKKVLPAGMAFPYDFGFVPSTVAEDGDPTDVLVLMDEPAFPGCLLRCRVIGIIEGEQGKKKECERNDRVVAVEQENHSYAHVKHQNLRSFHSGSAALQTLDQPSQTKKADRFRSALPVMKNHHFGRFLRTMSGDLNLAFYFRFARNHLTVPELRVPVRV